MPKKKSKKSKKERLPAQASLVRLSEKSFLPERIEVLEVRDQGDSHRSLAAVNLFERAKTDWQLGRWDMLLKLDPEQLRHHPDFSQLAAIAATAQFESGNPAQARKLGKLALEGGVPVKAFRAILLADSLRALAKCCMLDNREQDAKRHLVSAGMPLHSQLLLEGAELEKLDDVPGQPGLPTPRAIPAPSYEVGQSSPSGGGRKPTTTGMVVVVAGMRHSGSTALFNIIRLGFEAMGIETLSNYSEKNNIARQVRRSSLPCIIKTHELRDDVLNLATVVLTARRDLRNTVASAVRREFPPLKQFANTIEYAKYNRMLHEVWAPHSDYEFHYERFSTSPLKIVNEVFALLHIDQRHAEDVARQVANLPLDKYETTLLSASHITDPEHRLTFADTLSPSVIARIELEHHAWLARHGYFIQP